MEVLLNRKLVLEEALRTSDGFGGFDETWQALGTLWANVNTGAGAEGATAGGAFSVVKYRIVVRSAPFGAVSRPKPDQRFREGSRLFVIEAVAEHDGGGKFLECWAREEFLS